MAKERKSTNGLGWFPGFGQHNIKQNLLNRVQEALSANPSPEEIRQIKQEMQHREAELQWSRRMATLGIMASGLAHEINQPLQVILSIAQNCTREIQRDAIDSVGIVADLGQITTNVRRIDRIVNHLHVLARRHEPKLEAVNRAHSQNLGSVMQPLLCCYDCLCNASEPAQSYLWLPEYHSTYLVFFWLHWS